jgi:hypothetical protein
VSKNKKTKPKTKPDFLMPDLSGKKFEDVLKTMLTTPAPKVEKKARKL